MAPLLNRGRLKTGDEFNQHKKRSLVSLGYHEVKAGNKFWKEVNFLSSVIVDLASSIIIHRNNKSNFYSVHREEASNQGIFRLGPNYSWRTEGIPQPKFLRKEERKTCEALSERKSFQVIVKGHYTNMPPKLNRFNVGLFNKIKKQERDAVLCENTKLMNSVAEESRKLKSIQMKLKRLQAKVSNNYKVTDFYFIYWLICLFVYWFVYLPLPIHISFKKLRFLFFILIYLIICQLFSIYLFILLVPINILVSESWNGFSQRLIFQTYSIKNFWQGRHLQKKTLRM